MPVRRLRSLDEAERSLSIAPDDARLWPTITALWALSDRLSPPRFSPGLYKHASLHSLNEQSELWEAAAVRRRGT